MTSAVASAVRPGLRDDRQNSGSPHTPTRFISSNYSSPGSTFRQEEDAVVIELGARYLKAGFEGENSPQCVTAFGPEHSRRVGDYRFWAPGFRIPVKRIDGWAEDYELWQNDLREFDLGLLEDKLERCIREVYNNHLLTDVGTARLILVLPSTVPHPILSSVLSLLFERWNYPSITLLPCPTMAVVGAGLRSGLVIDIGWEECVVTPVYEYRELSIARTIRAMKRLNQEVGKLLRGIYCEHRNDQEKILPVSFAFTEEIINRAAFCKLREVPHTGTELLSEQSASLSINAEAPPTDPSDTDRDIEVEWPTQTSSVLIKISSLAIAKCTEGVLVHTTAARHAYDDHERSPGDVVYRVLLSLPPDVRATCMNRMVFIGGGSNIPGLIQRLMQDVEELVRQFGWNPVRGQKVEAKRTKSAEIFRGRTSPPSARHNTALLPGKDFIEERIQKQSAQSAQPHEQGNFREVSSLGSWSGASMLASLKIKGFVEIEKERFLSHGLSGAHRDTEISVVPQRMSSFGLAAAKQNERTNWTLAGWG